jgi:hypothetical protein
MKIIPIIRVPNSTLAIFNTYKKNPSSTKEATAGVWYGKSSNENERINYNGSE